MDVEFLFFAMFLEVDDEESATCLEIQSSRNKGQMLPLPSRYKVLLSYIIRTRPYVENLLGNSAEAMIPLALRERSLLDLICFWNRLSAIAVLQSRKRLACAIHQAQ